MMNKLMLGVAISALTIGGALAQSPTAPGSSDETRPPAMAPANPSANAPAEKMDKQPAKPESSAQSESAKPESSAQSESGKAETDSKAAAKTGNEAAGGEATVVASQSPDQFLSSSFEGTDVIGADDKQIGDVADILFEKDGTIKAYVISFGGFLGMGAKEVAISPSAFEVVEGKEGEAKKLKLSMTQDDLKSAQAFAKYQPPRPAVTTGAGSGTLGRSPAGGGTAPSER